MFFRNFHKCIVRVIVGGMGNNVQLGSSGFAPWDGSIEIVLLIDTETMLAMPVWLVPIKSVSFIKDESEVIAGILLFILERNL